ncbi:MAG: hypothetical protein JXC32_20390 [Anaerolineae bacterium]|nr:hypothetical protein [Anaerolineae bacterium]
MKARVGLGLVLLLVTLGCGLLELVAPTRESVPATLPDPTTTATPVPPTVTMTPNPSPTPAACPASQDLRPPTLTDSIEDNTAAIETYLDQGGDAQRIPLGDQEMLLIGDLTGNGTPEIVVTLVDPLSQQITPEGHMVVFTCQDGDVVQLYRYEPAEWYSLNLIALEDLNGDGVADLVFSDFSCGAHTCWHTPYVWSWGGDDFVSQIDAALQFPYPDFHIEGDDLIVVSGGIGSVGAGPQRPVTTTLSWTGDFITVTAETTAPPTYRYHALVDGDLAFAAGDMVSAVALYQRVVQDEVLTAWGAASSPEEEHDGLKALGQWRLVILNASGGDDAAAESSYAALMASPQPLAVREAVKTLAERFWRAYQRDGEVSSACVYAVDVEAAQTIVDFLYGFGYANPVFEQQDLCPHLRP